MRGNDWLVAINLRDAYLQVPVHPKSREFLALQLEGEPGYSDSLLQAVHNASGFYPGFGSGLRFSSSPKLPEVGPPAAASCSQIPSAIVLVSFSCMETFKRFALTFSCRLGLWCRSHLLGSLTQSDLRFP